MRKTKAIIAVLVALILVSSLASALSLSSIFYNKVESRITPTQQERSGLQAAAPVATAQPVQESSEIQAITPTQSLSIPSRQPTVEAAPSATPELSPLVAGKRCAASTECPDGACVCRCTAAPILAARTSTEVSRPAETPTLTAAAPAPEERTTVQPQQTATAAVEPKPEPRTLSIFKAIFTGKAIALPLQKIAAPIKTETLPSTADRTRAATPSLAQSGSGACESCLSTCRARCRRGEGAATTGRDSLSSLTGRLTLSGLRTATAPAAAVEEPVAAESAAAASEEPAAASAETTAADSVAECEARCTSTCSNVCGRTATPAAPSTGISAGGVCSSPGLCASECESGNYECSCEARAALGVVEREVGMPAETQARINARLDTAYEKLSALESRLIAEGAATEATFSQFPSCAANTDVNARLRNCMQRFSMIVRLLKNKNMVSAEQAAEAEAEIGETGLQEDASQEPAQGFGQRLRTFFGFGITGKVVAEEDVAVDVTGGPSVESTGYPETLTAEQKESYKATVNDISNNLLDMQERTCTKLGTIPDNSGLGTCVTDEDCGVTGAVKCMDAGSGAKTCKVDEREVCPQGELVPSGAGALSECRENSECTSGECRARVMAGGVPESTPLSFCWCASNSDCIEGRCNTDTGLCERITGTASSSTATEGSSTPAPIGERVGVRI